MRSSPGFATIRGALVALALLSCSSDEAMKRFTPADADARARRYLTLIVEHHTAEAEARILPSIAGPDTHAAFTKLDSVFGGQRFDSVRIVGVVVNTINGVRHANLTYEVRSQVGWLLANVATVDSLDTWFVEGVTGRRISRPLEAITAFTFVGKSAKYYVWLVLTIACAAVAIGTAGWLATRRAMPKRWRWVLVALLGVGSFSLNWATGETGFRVIAVQLFAAGAMRPGPVSPWILTFAIPVGALVSLRRYRHWRRTLASAPPSDLDATGPVPTSDDAV